MKHSNVHFVGGLCDVSLIDRDVRKAKRKKVKDNFEDNRGGDFKSIIIEDYSKKEK